jgi:hypothetical protein
MFCGCLDHLYFWEIFASFEITSNVMQVDKICLRILWTWPAWHTCPCRYCNPQLLQPRFSTNLHLSPLPVQRNIFFKKKFKNLCQNFLNNDIYIRLAAITTNYRDGNLGYNLLLSRAFSVGIPLTVGFRPQHVVVSGLSVGIPLMVGFRLSRSLWLSRSLFTNSSSFHDRILAIGKPFTRTFSFFTMEFWLSGSLSHEFFLFSRCNSGY